MAAIHCAAIGNTPYACMTSKYVCAWQKTTHVPRNGSAQNAKEKKNEKKWDENPINLTFLSDITRWWDRIETFRAISLNELHPQHTYMLAHLRARWANGVSVPAPHRNPLAHPEYGARTCAIGGPGCREKSMAFVHGVRWGTTLHTHFSPPVKIIFHRCQNGINTK